jgi:hypothetical protein
MPSSPVNGKLPCRFGDPPALRIGDVIRVRGALEAEPVE